MGLALSGGGIRSATFSLGILKALSAAKLLTRVDYLSTVSGGGYTGAFYCGLYARRGECEPLIKPRRGDFDPLAEPGARRALAYLRQSGRYLTPSGARDYVYAVTLLIRNWVALALVSGILIMFLALLLSWARLPLARSIHGYADMLWLSPLAIVAALLLPVLLGTGWAYWLTQRDTNRPIWFRPPILGNLAVITALGWLLLDDPPSRTPGTQWIWAGLLTVAILAFLCWGMAVLWKGRAKSSDSSSAHGRGIQQDRVRQTLTSWQASVAAAILVLGVIAAGDSLSFWFAGVTGEFPFSRLAILLSSLPIIPLARLLVRKLPNLTNDASTWGAALFARFGSLLVLTIAFGLGAVAILLWGGLAHFYAGPVLVDGDMAMREPFYWLLGGSGLAVLLIGITQDFVNLSSLATFYAARLRRAYLGAGNPDRIADSDGKKAGKPVTDSLAGDDLGLEDYYHRIAGGAPVHIINVTINETRSTGANTVQRDRKGRNLAISPGGFLYSGPERSEPSVRLLGETAWEEAGKPREGAGQSLPLSTWIGISGAAFTTGRGSGTSLAFALLAFMANVRLGYWWRRDRKDKTLGVSYGCLLRELTASYGGVDKRLWYLSDGGHFENTGVYELVRRRIPFIIASDNSCDPAYGFEDVANLVRKCRIDFGAQIDLLTSAQLDLLFPDSPLRALFAPIEQFSDPELAPEALAIIGRIAFAPEAGKDQDFGTLLLIKPRLTRNGSADLMRYLADNPDFPQQTTFDQFFDEAQWESYYELGRRIGTELFRERRGAEWQPRNLRSVDWQDPKWADHFA